MAARYARTASATLAILAALLVVQPAGSVELQDLKGFEGIFGRYAPGGDCKRQPQIRVDATGLTFEVGGKSETVTNPEYAASYGGHDYAGSTIWMFPFRLADGYSILMAFNSDEKAGVLSITGHDEGYPGGPKLSPRNEALVKGSPYARCK
jgi:hypothetical protein